MKKIIILLILIILLTGGTYLWWTQSLTPVDPQNKSTQIFVVQNGEGMRELANHLQQVGLIRNSTAFFLLTKQLGDDNKIQAGDFRLSQSMSAQQVIQNLTHGVLDVWVTIPEGKRSEEIAQILKDKIPNYQDIWQEQLKKQEGYLFPDTYLLPLNSDVSFMIDTFKKNFDKKYSELQQPTSNSYSQQQIVIIASLIEREARFAEDQPLIASVIYNRLKIGMPLQIDSTIQYTLGYQATEKTWWKKDLSTEDLKIDSPYNTYTNTGLPPSPICNPGQGALQAAMNPANTQYLYYVADKTGHSHFAKTFQEHNLNIQKYGL